MRYLAPAFRQSAPFRHDLRLTQRAHSSSTGVTVALNSNNTVRGLNLTGTAGPTVSGNNFGTLTASDLSITGGLPALSLISRGCCGNVRRSLVSGGATGVLLNAVTGTLNINGGAISGATAPASPSSWHRHH